MVFDGFRWFWKGLGGFGRVWEGLEGVWRGGEGWEEVDGPLQHPKTRPSVRPPSVRRPSAVRPSVRPPSVRPSYYPNGWVCVTLRPDEPDDD